MPAKARIALIVEALEKLQKQRQRKLEAVRKEIDANYLQQAIDKMNEAIGIFDESQEAFKKRRLRKKARLDKAYDKLNLEIDQLQKLGDRRSRNLEKWLNQRHDLTEEITTIESIINSMTQ